MLFCACDGGFKDLWADAMVFLVVGSVVAVVFRVVAMVLWAVTRAFSETISNLKMGQSERVTCSWFLIFNR